MSDGGDVRLHLSWATELVIARGERAATPAAASPCGARPAGALEASLRRLEDRARRIAGGLAGVDHRDMRVAARRMETWDSESDLRLLRGATSWQALSIPGGPAAESVDASLLIHDPRAATAAAEAPGLPFGRPVSVRLTTGVMVVMPGWLEWSIRPFPSGPVLEVLRLDLCTV